MNKWVRITAIVGMVVVVLLAVPFLIPMQSYINQAETIASQKLGVPVKIKSLQLAFLPTPRINAGGVVVGNDNQLSVESVSVVPAIFSLLSDVKVISQVRIVKPIVKKSALDILAAYSQINANPAEPNAISVRHIVLKGAKLEWPGLVLPEADADIKLGETNQPQEAKIETTDGKVKLNLIPKGEQQSITLLAEKWTVPIGSPLLLDKLEMDMTLKGSKLLINTIAASLYQGKVDGNAELDWSKGWRTSGKINVKGLDVSKPTSLVSKSTHVSGSLSGNGSFSATAKEPAQLADKIGADFRFKVYHGVLYGLDLVKAASLFLRSGQKGGDTQFDELSGLLHVTGRQYELRDLKVRSGLLSADGAVKILPSKQLDGVMNAEIKNSASLVAIPLQISGTLDKPVVLPTKAAMAGAVAGTAILGPGVGTSLGVKAGSAVGKIKDFFGGDKK